MPFDAFGILTIIYWCTFIEYLVVVAIWFHSAIESVSNWDNYKCDYAIDEHDVLTNEW